MSDFPLRLRQLAGYGKGLSGRQRRLCRGAADVIERQARDVYRWRRLYEETARQMTNLYAWADEHGIELPSPGWEPRGDFAYSRLTDDGDLLVAAKWQPPSKWRHVSPAEWDAIEQPDPDTFYVVHHEWT